MNEKDQARAAANEMAEAIFDGSSLLQRVAWRAFLARHEADLPAEIEPLARAVLAALGGETAGLPPVDAT